MMVDHGEDGPPMTGGNSRDPGAHRLLVSCLNPDCRHEALIDVSSYLRDATVPSLIPRLNCSWCGGKRVDVRPN